MCGIIGAFALDGSLAGSVKYVRWGAQKMQRRGPDAEGFKKIDNVAFGFRRLAIRDLSSAANQPMIDESERYMLVFNGEIYNIDELKKTLGKEVGFRTTSDTEVLFRCLVQLGVYTTLNLLDGIFAFAWFDKSMGSLTLARDRCGVKPLYYALNERVLLFSSEYDLLLCHEEFAYSSINPDALEHYLHLGFIPDGEGLYKHTYLLPHGHYLSIDIYGHHVLRSYYEFPWRNSINSGNSLSEVLKSSVTSQLVSDVPLGIFLSGGIDSSLVSLLAISENPDLESFTIGVESGGAMDESNVASSFAQSINMSHNLRMINSNEVMETLIQQNTEAFSEPFADYSSLPMLLLSAFAHEHVTVALSGDGGDELFWGYPRNVRAASLMNYFNYNQFYRLLLITWKRITGSKPNVPFKLVTQKDFVQFAFQQTFITGSKLWAGRIFPHTTTYPFFLKKLVDDLEANPPKNESDWLNVLRKIEFDFHLQRVLLKVDRASMYHSLEVRVPMLSNEMLNASINYRFTDCIKECKGKMPLRDLLNKLHPNSGIAGLPKKGFTLPLDKWIKGKLYSIFESRIKSVPPEFDNYLNQKGIYSLWESCTNQNNAWIVWAIFTLFEWYDKRLAGLRQNYKKFKNDADCNRS